MRKNALLKSGALDLRFLVAFALCATGTLMFSVAANAPSRTKAANAKLPRVAKPVSRQTATFIAAQTGNRTATYQSGGFTFGLTKQLLPAALPVGQFQNVEPEIKIDLFGNIYVTAIQGVPDGMDLWKSTDQGNSFTFIGQPDGVQCPTPPTCVDEVGVGGADDSTDISSGGYLIYVESLVRESFRIDLDKRRLRALDAKPGCIQRSVGRPPMACRVRTADALP